MLIQHRVRPKVSPSPLLFFPLNVVTTSMYVNKYTMERMINARFMWSLESQRLLSENQCGFVRWVILFIVKRSRCPYWFMYSYFILKECVPIIFFDTVCRKKAEVYNTMWKYGIASDDLWHLGFTCHWPLFMGGFCLIDITMSEFVHRYHNYASIRHGCSARWHPVSCSF